MTARLNMDKIARALGAERRGSVSASGGYFGALQVQAEIASRFRVPAGGGRATDPAWTERRLVPLAPQTLRRLDEMAAKLWKQEGVRVQPMQLAAVLLEKAAEQLTETEAGELVRAQ